MLCFSGLRRLAASSLNFSQTWSIRCIGSVGKLQTLSSSRAYSQSKLSSQNILKTTKHGLRKKHRPNKASIDSITTQKAPFQGNTTTDLVLRNIVTAYCTAQEYDMEHVNRILHQRGIQAGLSGSLLYPDEPKVIHIEMPLSGAKGDVSHITTSQPLETGDVFIFPSGVVVAWAIDKPNVDSLIEVLQPAALDPLGANAEDENLEYLEDPVEQSSTIRGETIILGTKSESFDDVSVQSGHRPLRVVLAKIAFSSGLARATKLAVLENFVDEYSQSSRDVLAMLNGGFMSRLKPRRWIYQRMGSLLDLRAQLNLYSELADDLPDLFWDTKQELGLEGYYDQVGSALDVLQRIKILNQKMDYAEQIIGNLRDMRSETHSSRLEWIIIWLILFEVLHIIWIDLYRIPQERETAKQEEHITAKV